MKRQRYVNTLVKPRTHLALSDKSFSIAAPAVWNDLSIDLRAESSSSKFHKSLKSAMFNSTFGRSRDLSMDQRLDEPSLTSGAIYILNVT